ncbi:four-carbon acid sugar kinase family protein [Serinicoccus chungangensis]|uniref:four-carbon acid sugar kinase family protein n=1 Tax=Serinicoccus chungangensis TaxID=767452 RepID=UPI001119C6C6|nr:four-carbon acid sugar kinase family protein [Serinicoccus chungangensis]
MARVLVVADDLTGANACAAGFARAGMRAVTLGQTDPAGTIAEFHSCFDVIVVTTESRHAPAAEVRERVGDVVRAGWPVELLSTRIDTTLRGNVGVATEAMLTVAREVSDRRVVALCLPAHPSADRVTVEGHQLLRGMRLESTELAHDPRAPVDTSDVAEVLSRSTDLRVRHLPLRLVTGSQEELVAGLRELVTDEVDVVVADAMTVEHLDRVATAATASTDDILWVTVDPGPGAVAMASAMGLPEHSRSGPLLAVSGSATELTRTQLQRLITDRPCRVVRPRTLDDSVVPDVDATVPLLVEELEQAEPGAVVLLATVLDARELRPLSADEGEALPAALGRITRRALQETRVDGLYTTGGDITAAVLHEVDGQGLEIEDEVVPLAVAGEIVSGPWAGLPMVTKGGLVGDAETALLCLDRLAGMARDRLRSVRTATSHERARR